MILGNPAPYGWLSLPFGSAKFPYSIFNRHRGTDHGWLEQLPSRPAGITAKSRQVFAPVSGTIVHVSDGFTTGKHQNQGWGNYLEIRVSSRVKIRLCHFMKGTLAPFKVGQRINSGDYIGQMGNSGDTSSKIHLHEELWIDGKRVDPEKYRGKHLPGTEPAPAAVPKPTPTPVLPEEEEDDMALKIIVGPKGNPAAGKYVYDPESGKVTRPVHGAAESAVLRAVEAARPDAVVFVEVDPKLLEQLKG